MFSEWVLTVSIKRIFFHHICTLSKDRPRFFLTANFKFLVAVEKWLILPNLVLTIYLFKIISLCLQQLQACMLFLCIIWMYNCHLNWAFSHFSWWTWGLVKRRYLDTHWGVHLYKWNSYWAEFFKRFLQLSLTIVWNN